MPSVAAEAETPIVNAEPDSIQQSNDAKELPTEAPIIQPVQPLVNEPSEQSVDEAMDDVDEQQIESSKSEDASAKNDVTKSSDESTVASNVVECVEPVEQTIDESVSASETQEDETKMDTGGGGGDDDGKSVTQSDDNKRDGESDSDRKEQRKRKRSRSRSRSRSKSPSPSAKRTRRASPVQNTDDFTNAEDEPEIDANSVLLSWFDSDLNLKINSSEFLSARPISDGPLHMAWAGARATHGVKSGKASYEVYIDELSHVRGLRDRNVHEVRCGWSVKTANLQLGEAPLSFGYGGSGKKSLNNEFTDYGTKFKYRGDVIGVYLDLDSEPCKIEYTVNGEPQGTAFEFDKSELGDEALYPHILAKNTGFKVNFGGMEKPFVSKIVSKTERDDRRESRRDRRSERDSKRDRSRSRSRSHSRDERRDRSEETEKSSTSKKVEDESASESQADASASPTSKNDADKPVAEEKTEEKPEEVSADVAETEEKTAEGAVDANGDNQPKSAEEDPPAEKTILPGYEFIGKLPIEQLVPGYR